MSIKVGLDEFYLTFYFLISYPCLLMPDTVAQSDTRVAGQLVCLKTLQLPMHQNVPLGPASTDAPGERQLNHMGERFRIIPEFRILRLTFYRK